MKKVLSFLLAGILLVLLMPYDISATESNCYIATTNCPQGYIDYAEENVSAFVMCMGEELNYQEIKVGSPFAFADNNADMYYFPVICDGVITYLFRVYPNGEGYSGAITEFLAEDIEKLSGLTSASAPMYLNLRNNKIIATIGNTEYQLFEYPMENSLTNQSIVNTQNIAISAQNYEVVNVKENCGWELSLIQPRGSFNLIELDIVEYQGFDSWCNAYCLATVIRTQTDFYTTAGGCMTIAVGRNPSKTTKFPWNKVATVCEQYGLSPIVLNTTISDELMISEIAANRPVIARMVSGEFRHSIVFRGYNSYTYSWSVWNPYYKVYEHYSMDSPYVPTGYTAADASYYPYSHAYNFQ